MAEELEEISVIGKKTKSSPLDQLPTVNQLKGQELNRIKQTTLGETLGAELGVRSSFYGPNASRPVIRGLEGDRIRILQNGMGTLDASGASQDHAVAIDPFTVERIEILRGGAALLYGNQAIGGVVNLVSNRTPQRLSPRPEIKSQLQASSVDHGKTVMLSSDSSIGKWAQHIDFSKNQLQDYHVSPGATEVRNSWNNSTNGAVGSSYIDGDHLLGASFSQFQTDYGTIAEPDVFINLKQQRGEFIAEKRNFSWARSVRLKAAMTDYQHKEIEGAAVGTIFKNKGNEARLEMKHKPLGNLNGTIGYHYNQFHFEALGSEAFLPSTNNKSHALFLFEEINIGDWSFNVGARMESNQVVNERTNVQKSFLGNSTSLGSLFHLNSKQSIGLNASVTQRAPNYQELFASGVHIATGNYQLGDTELSKEKGAALELTLNHKEENRQAQLNAYVQHYSDFIFLTPTGSKDSGSGFDIYQYKHTRAKFYGVEGQYTHQFMDLFSIGFLELVAKAEVQRGIDLDTNNSLPRMAPIRETLTLSYKTDHFNADLDVQHNHRQTQVSGNESKTAGYTMSNMHFAYHGHLGRNTYSLFLRIRNLFNVDARNHLSLIKDLAPLPGRNAVLGMQFFY